MPAPTMAPPPRRNMMMLAIAAVVVVVIIVVLALFLSGVLTPKSTSSGGGSSAFATGRSSAQSAADSQSGGPWTLIIADGTASTTSVSESTSTLTGQFASGCTFTAASGAPSTMTLSAVSDVSTGVAGGWLFLFKNTGSSSVLAIGVTGTSATVLGTIGGSSCFGGLLSSFSGVPSNVVDSGQVAAAANGQGGSTFLAAHSGAWASYSVSGGASYLGFSTPAEWTVAYSGCPISGGAGTSSAEFTASVNATTAAVTSTSTTTVSCA